MFIQEQAEHFYNSYLILNESRKSLSENLSNPTNLEGKNQFFGRYPTMGIEVVCLSFSVELYIKCLHYMISQEIPRGHNILNLFKKLPNQSQQELFNHPAIVKYGWNFDKFEQMIDSISDSFEKWRYSYESQSLTYNSYFASVFVKAIKESISLFQNRKYNTGY